MLQESCYGYIVRQGRASLRDLAAFIRAKAFAKVELSPEDIETIVNTLVYDGRVDALAPGSSGGGASASSSSSTTTEVTYQPAVLTIPATTPLTSIPCGTCPVFDQCAEGGLVSPQTCEYYNRWLAF